MGRIEEMFFVGREPGGDRPALLAWRQNSLEMKSLEPLAHFADDHSAEYFWALLEQLLNDAARTGEVGVVRPQSPGNP